MIIIISNTSETFLILCINTEKGREKERDRESEKKDKARKGESVKKEERELRKQEEIDRMREGGWQWEKKAFEYG